MKYQGCLDELIYEGQGLSWWFNLGLGWQVYWWGYIKWSNKLQPHPNLKQLSIKNYPSVRFPNWLGDPSVFSLESHVPWASGLWQLLNIATTWASNPYEISTNLKDEWSGVWVVSLCKCFLSIPKDTVIWGYVELEEMVMLWRIPSSPEAFYTIVFQTHWEINRTASLIGGTSNS